MIAHLDGTVSGGRPGRRRDRRRRRRAAGAVHARHAGRRCGRATRASVATSLIVREDSLTLYGFATEDERNVFELLQTASGVGPRLALAMLAVHEPDALRLAVASEDLTALTRVPGIGKKGAQRIVLELRDRLGAAGEAGGRCPARRPRRRRAWRDQVQAGLVSLGWAARDAEQAITAVEPELAAGDGPVDVAAALRAALRRLSDAMTGSEPGGPAPRRGAGRATTRLALVAPRRTATSGRSRARCGPSGWRSSSARPGCASSSSLVLESALRRGRPPDHVLLCGPPGLGKTTIAMIIAAELGAPLRITSGPAIERAGDLAAVLSTLSEGEVLFIDEIHRMARPAEEMLYLAMEDFRVDVVVGKGPGATAIPLDIAPFTLVGATTRAGLLPGAAARPVRLHRPPGLLRRRRARDHRAQRSAGLLGVEAARRRAPPRSPGARAARRGSPTGCCAGCATTPRSAADGVISRDIARAALELYEVDEEGLDRLDRGVLDALMPAVRRRPGRAVHPGRGRGRGDGDRRGRGRAVPGPVRAAGQDPARPGGHPGGLGASRPHPARAAGAGVPVRLSRPNPGR